MLSEKAIENLIQPLLDRQSQIEGVVLGTIAERLKDIGTMTPSDIYKLERLLKTGSDAKKINKQISRLTKLSENEIKKIIRTVAKDSYEDVKPFYDYRNKSFIPFEKNEELQKYVKSVEKVTANTFINLSNSTAFMYRNGANSGILTPTPASQIYNKVIDNAIQIVSSGMDTYNTVIPNSIRQLVNSGIKSVEYTTESGKRHYVRLDTVVRRNILDGIRDIQQNVQNITGEQFGADGVEISVHQYSAPDHEPVQGHQFTKEEFEKMQNGENFKDVKNRKFKGFDRHIGIWNCRHFAWNIIIGHATPNYTDKQLEELKQKNANGMTVRDRNGNNIKKSMYWCTQRQREYELKIRKNKEGLAMAKKAGQQGLIQEYNGKITTIQNEYTYFCKKCGLKPRYDKTRVYI